MEVGSVWRSKRVIKKTAEVHRIFLKEESRAQIKKVKCRNKSSLHLSGFDVHCTVPCAASLAGIPPGGLGLSGLVHEEAHPSISKRF